MKYTYTIGILFRPFLVWLLALGFTAIPMTAFGKAQSTYTTTSRPGKVSYGTMGSCRGGSMVHKVGPRSVVHGPWSMVPQHGPKW